MTEPAHPHEVEEATRRALRRRADKVAPRADLDGVLARSAASPVGRLTGGRRLSAVAAAVVLVGVGALGLAVGRATAPDGGTTVSARGPGSGPGTESGAGADMVGAPLLYPDPGEVAGSLTPVLTRTANGVTLRLFEPVPVEVPSPGSMPLPAPRPSLPPPSSEAPEPETRRSQIVPGCDPTAHTSTTLTPETCAVIGPTAPDATGGEDGGSVASPPASSSDGSTTCAITAGSRAFVVEASTDEVAAGRELSVEDPVGTASLAASATVMGVGEGHPFAVVVVSAPTSAAGSVVQARVGGSTDRAELVRFVSQAKGPTGAIRSGTAVAVLALPLPAGSDGQADLAVSVEGLGALTLGSRGSATTAQASPAEGCSPPVTFPSPEEPPGGPTNPTVTPVPPSTSPCPPNANCVEPSPPASMPTVPAPIR